MQLKELIQSSRHRVEAFYNLLRIRRIEEAVAKNYSAQEMRCPVHFSIGQEAVAVAACHYLTDDDYVTSTHRAHAHYLAKGGDLDALIAEFYGKETGCSGGYGGSMHLSDLNAGFLGSVPIVGSTISIGVGAAFGAKLQNKNNITVIFLGEGATEEGVFFESLNFALLHKLAVIFVCENNLYSIITSLDKRRPKGADLSKIVESFGAHSYKMDGQDLCSMLDQFQTIIASMRHSPHPVFIECETYRYLEHCGPNQELNLRSESEIKKWKKRDPVDITHHKLMHENFLTSVDVSAFEQAIQREIDHAFMSAKKASFPPRENLMRHVYKETP